MSGILKRLKPSRTMLFGIVGILVAINYYGDSAISVPSPTVQISTGKIQGIVSKSRDGKDFFEYRGVPYAKAPVGELRFESPVPPVSWDGVRDASKFEPDCIQVNPIFPDRITGSEDCLFLNVYSPKVGSTFSENPLPVMVFLHGGYFMSGSAVTHPPKYFMDEYIVLVTVNYRLSSLGFLNTGDGIVRGNMGMRDQTMALKWVQQNIRKFGGDSNRVTLFGESAGATAVNYHMVSPMSKGLFHKAICQSGTATKTWAKQVDPKKQAELYIKRLNCEKPTMEESVRCLKGLKAETIIESHKDANNPIPHHLHKYAPSIETFDKNGKDCFISEDPKTIISSGRASNIPWMVGMNSGEGLLYTARAMIKPNEYERNFDTIFPQVLAYDKNRQDVTAKLRKFYFDANSADDNADFIVKFQNYTNMLSDRYYNSDTRSTALLQSKYSSVYLYYNDYSADFTLYDYLSLDDKLPRIVEIFWKVMTNYFRKTFLKSKSERFGVCHGDELSLLFPFPLAEITPASNDFEMSGALVKLWVSFAYDDTKMKFNGVPWTPVSPNSTSLKYMQFSNTAEGNNLIDEPFRERTKFWESLKLPN